MVVAVTIRTSSGQKRKPLANVSDLTNRAPKRQATLEFFNFKGPRVAQPVSVKAEPDYEPRSLVHINFAPRTIPAASTLPGPTAVPPPSQNAPNTTPSSSRRPIDKPVPTASRPSYPPVNRLKSRLDSLRPLPSDTLSGRSAAWFSDLKKAFLAAPDVPDPTASTAALEWGTLKDVETYSQPVQLMCSVGLFVEAAVKAIGTDDLCETLFHRYNLILEHAKGLAARSAAAQSSVSGTCQERPSLEQPSTIPGVSHPWVLKLTRSFLNAADIPDPDTVVVKKAINGIPQRDPEDFSEHIRNLLDVGTFAHKLANEKSILKDHSVTYTCVQERLNFLKAYRDGLVTVPSTASSFRFRSQAKPPSPQRETFVKFEPEDSQLPEIPHLSQSSTPTTPTTTYYEAPTRYSLPTVKMEVEGGVIRRKQIFYRDDQGRFTKPENGVRDSTPPRSNRAQVSPPSIINDLPAPSAPKLRPIYFNGFQILTPEVYHAYYAEQEHQRAAVL